MEATPKGKLRTWIDDRFPLTEIWENHLSKYYAPKNLNFWYFFGALALFVLVNQILTGIWLAMYYVPTAKEAFSSVEFIMRDVNYGWLLRYMSSTGASAFFIVVYLHIFRALLYGSYQKPRELVWLIGMFIFLFLLAEAFMGYLLPWGQMSYWGAQVITSLFGAIPYVGEKFLIWLRGDFTVSTATLQRFYAFHIVGIPLIIIFLVWMHIIALHRVGSNNPDGIEIKNKKNKYGRPLDGIPFYPYYTSKDLFGYGVFLFLAAFFVFYFPEGGGYFLEHANFVPADPLQTPTYIVPVWYMTPYYAILRAIPNKQLGVLLMLAAILLPFFLPWLDPSPVRSIRYRGLLSKINLGFFAVSFLVLGYLGLVHVTPIRTLLARIFSVIYFAFFLLLPFISKYDKTYPVPERVT